MSRIASSHAGERRLLNIDAENGLSTSLMIARFSAILAIGRFLGAVVSTLGALAPASDFSVIPLISTHFFQIRAMTSAFFERQLAEVLLGKDRRAVVVNQARRNQTQPRVKVLDLFLEHAVAAAKLSG